MLLQIYHTNDIHGDFDFLARVQAWMAENRKPGDLWLDSGDYTDLKNLVVQSDRGIRAMGLMREAGVDAIALGNNEIDLGADDVARIASFPLLCVNARHNDGTEIPGLSGSVIVERGGRRILLLGFAPYYNWRLEPNHYNVFFEMGNISTIEPIAAARQELERRKGSYDFCIALSHSGHLVDAMLREKLPEVDLWLGGHSHETMTELAYSQSGKGEHLGRVTLEIGESGIRCLESVQIDPPEAAAPEFGRCLKEAKEYADRILSEELETVGELDFDPFGESPLTNYLCDCLRHHFGGDLAVMHSGIAEGSLLRPVSRKSLIENFPSKLNPTVYRIAGSAILEAAQLALDPEHIRQDGKGAGFRGRVLGTLGYSSNVQIQREPFAMFVDGQPVEPGRMYTLVTDDYLQRGTGYPSLRVPDEEAHFDKWFIRDMVQHSLTEEALFRSAYIPRERGKESGI